MATELHIPLLDADRSALDRAQREATEALHTAGMHGSVLFNSHGLRIVVLTDTTEERVKGLLSNHPSFRGLFASDGSERAGDELLLGEAEEGAPAREELPSPPPSITTTA